MPGIIRRKNSRNIHHISKIIVKRAMGALATAQLGLLLEDKSIFLPAG